MNKNDLKRAKKQWEKLPSAVKSSTTYCDRKTNYFKLLCLIILVQTAKYMLC